VTSVWESVDPMTDKYPQLSDYNFSINNPINFVDFNGKDPTDKEAAAMASHVYGDKSDKILRGGWKVSKKDFGIKKTDENGFKSQVYERTKKGKTEYVYATAGTENGNDWDDNLTQPAGASSQYKKSMANAEQISKVLGKDVELTFTGHSLGGGLATANAYKTGRNAITFNAAGTSPFTISRNPASKIEAYIMLSDPLNILQDTSPLMPDVDGKRHYLIPTDFSSVYNGHSMDNVLKNFDIDPEHPAPGAGGTW
jgi:hypothetical protein